jgi:FkbM family methyltransferase
MRKRRASFNGLEVTLIGIGLLILGALVGGTLVIRAVQQATDKMAAIAPTDTREQALLKSKYGPATHSAGVEEWILKDFFGERRNGVFVDVGANHYEFHSNTYYLETALGWSGVAIEPQVEFADGYAQHRPRTTFVPLFVSDVSDSTATLYVTGNPMVASGVQAFTSRFGETKEVSVKTTTLDAILDRLAIPQVDFLSMDIELGELKALAGFSIGRFQPDLVAVEAHPPIRQQLLDYFAAHNYTLVGKYWRADADNFWFAPVGTVHDEAD